MKYSIFCLSLATSIDRRQAFRQQGSRYGIQFTYVDAPDANLLPSVELYRHVSQISALRIHGKRLSAGEAACALGHRKIYDTLLASDDDAALIFEDDVLIDPGIQPVLEGLARMIPSRDCSFIYFLRQRVSKKGRLGLTEDGAISLTNQHKLKKAVIPNNCLKGTDAYLISRRAAANILSSQEIECVADGWDYFMRKQYINELRFIDPPVVRHNDQLGSIIKKHVKEPPQNEMKLCPFFDQIKLLWKQKCRNKI